jgi:hypothetical protein
MLRTCLLAASIACACTASRAHTVDLGKEISPGACAAVADDSGPATKQAKYAGGVKYYDGRVPLSVVLIPKVALPDGKPDDTLSQCAIKVAQNLEKVPPGLRGVSEDKYRLELNSCLSKSRPRHEIVAAVFRRGAVECGEAAPAAANWQEALRAEMKRCEAKSAFISRPLCETRARNRFCDKSAKSVPACQEH